MCLLLSTTASRHAWALNDSDKEAIRELSNDAAIDYNEGRFVDAKEKFSRAYALAKVPKLAVWVARSYERLGRLVTAYEVYRQAVRLQRSELWVGDTQEQAQREAEQELAALIPRLAKVTVVVEGADVKSVEVKIDGEPVPGALLGVARFVDPGLREITGVYQGEVVRKLATIAEGGLAKVELAFSRSTSQASSNAVVASNQPKASSAPAFGAPAGPRDAGTGESQRTWGWVGIGIGGAGLLTGIVTGAVVASKYGDLKRDCPNSTCASNYESSLDSYRSMRTLSTIGLIVGGAGGAVGLTLILTSPKPATANRTAASLGVWAMPSMAGVEGTF